MKTAQDVRELLARHGWFPLVAIDQGEHWVNKGQRCVLLYPGIRPGKASIKDTTVIYPPAFLDGVVKETTF